ncbi:MAG: thioesterase family protein [Rikenellaceae bacterium]
MLKQGLEFKVTTTVDENLTALHMGSGDMRVYATPAMIALMENAAMKAVAEFIGEGNATVGTFMSASHIKASALGETITATATLTEVEGRKLSFRVSASDSQGVVGEGEHTRFIVDREKFMSKITK